MSLVIVDNRGRRCEELSGGILTSLAQVIAPSGHCTLPVTSHSPWLYGDLSGLMQITTI